jgi:hypothetical protein
MLRFDLVFLKIPIYTGTGAMRMSVSRYFFILGLMSVNLGWHAESIREYSHALTPGK